MAITTKTTITTKKERVITLTDNELCDVLRQYFEVDPSAEIDFDIRQGSYLGGCTITEVTHTTKEEPND